MDSDRVGGKGILFRFIGALLLVYGTFNPEGYSFFHWAVRPFIRGPVDAARAELPLKILAAFVLLGFWAFFLKTTKRSIGVKGAFLVFAIVGVLVWLFIEWRVFNPTSSRAIGHLVLLALAVVLTLGMSWSHISRRVSGQVDTDDIN